MAMIAIPALAQTASPDPVAALPGQVIGVTGGVGGPVLHLRSAQGERSLKLGDSLQDGWVLSELNPTEASFSKAGISRRIGLNPTGALSDLGAAQAPASVNVLPSLGEGGPDRAQADPQARAEALATIQQRLAALETAPVNKDAQYALDYLRAERDRLSAP